MAQIKVLVLGSSGMLGHILYNYLSNNKNFQLFNISYRERLNSETIICDVTRLEELEKHLKFISPNIIINCIGILLQKANYKPSRTIFLNSYFPHKLEELSKANNSKLIHVSTDCVFNGLKGNYSEDDIVSPKDLYGKSKYLGEQLGSSSLILRTSIIGPELKKNGQGLLHWIMNQKSSVDGYTNVYWGGVTTLQLSKVIEKSIDKQLSGLLHVTNKKKISKYDLLQLINKHLKYGRLNIKRTEVKFCDKSLTSNYSYFDNIILNYEDMIIEMKENMLQNKNRFNYLYKI